MVEAVAGRSLRVVEQNRIDPDAVGEGERLARAEAVMREGTGQHVERDGKERRREQPAEGVLGAGPVEIAAIGVDRAGAVQNRRFEERQTRRVIQMQVAEQQVDILRQALAAVAPEGAEARAGIDHEQTFPAADLQARRIAAELGVLRATDRRRAADAPETQDEGIVLGWIWQGHGSVPMLGLGPGFLWW